MNSIANLPFESRASHNYGEIEGDWHYSKVCTIKYIFGVDSDDFVLIKVYANYITYLVPGHEHLHSCYVRVNQSNKCYHVEKGEDGYTLGGLMRSLELDEGRIHYFCMDRMMEEHMAATLSDLYRIHHCPILRFYTGENVLEAERAYQEEEEEEQMSEEYERNYSQQLEDEWEDYRRHDY